MRDRVAAVGAAADRDRRRPGLTFEQARRGAVRATVPSTGSCGTAMPSDPQKSASRRRRADDARVATRPCSVTTRNATRGGSMPRTA